MAKKFKITFHLTDGSTIYCMPGDYRAVVDRRTDDEPPQRVWEILVSGYVIRQLWPEQIATWEKEPVL